MYCCTCKERAVSGHGKHSEVRSAVVVGFARTDDGHNRRQRAIFGFGCSTVCGLALLFYSVLIAKAFDLYSRCLG